MKRFRIIDSQLSSMLFHSTLNLSKGKFKVIGGGAGKAVGNWIKIKYSRSIETIRGQRNNRHGGRYNINIVSCLVQDR